MELIIKGFLEEIKKVLHTVKSSEEQFRKVESLKLSSRVHRPIECNQR